MIISRLENLFTQYYLGTISHEEESELATLLDNDEIEDQVLIAYQNVLEKYSRKIDNNDIIISDRVERQIKNIISLDKDLKADNNISILSRHKAKFLGIAATLIAVLFASLWFYKSLNSKSQLENKITEIKHDFLPGKEGAVLTFSDGTEIMVDNLGNSGEIATKDGAIIQIVNGQIIYKSSKHTNSTVKINKLSTPKGRRYQLNLADGTKVFLNASTTIIFPTVFDKASREVTITGEAYFEVAKDKKKPFIVKVLEKPIEIQVLGTHFNLKAYDADKQQITTLLEGKVKVSNGDNSNTISPYQQIVSTTNQNVKNELSIEDMENIMAWKENRFSFNNDKIDRVLIELARWYDFDVKFVGDIPEDTYTGKIDKNLSFKQVLSILGATKLKYKITKDNQLIIL